MSRRGFWLVAVLGCLAPGVAAQSPAPLPPLDSLRVWAARDSLDARAYFDLGIGLWSAHKYDAADTALRRALWLAPHYAEPRLALAILPIARGERYMKDLAHHLTPDSLFALARASQRLYRDAFLLDPLVDPRVLRFVDPDLLLPPISRIVFTRDGVYINDTWWIPQARRGIKALVEGRNEEAFASLDSVLHAPQMQNGTQLPDVFVWYYGLASAHTAHYDRAAAAFKELAQRAFRRQEVDASQVIPSERADYLYLYAAMSEQNTNLAVAIPSYQSALELDFAIFQAHSRLADIHESLGDVEHALIERRRAIDVSPETGKLHLDLGVTLLQAGRTAAAESAFVDAARLLPNDAGAQQFLATVALQLADTATARPALARFVLVAPARYAEQVAEARRTLAALP